MKNRTFRVLAVVVMGVVLAGLAGCTYRKETGRFESVPPMGSNTVDGVMETVAWLQSREVPVATPPPPIPADKEKQTPPPEDWADPYWVEGHWGWQNGKWVWIPSQWIKRPRDGAIWIVARYSVRDGKGYWRPGYWE